MARSVWKGPFVESYVLKKAEAARESGIRDFDFPNFRMVNSGVLGL